MEFLSNGSCSEDSIYIGTTDALYKLPVADCQRYTDCWSCIEARDPYCAYNTNTNKCVAVNDGIRGSQSLVQSVGDGDGDSSMCVTPTGSSTTTKTVVVTETSGGPTSDVVVVTPSPTVSPRKSN